MINDIVWITGVSGVGKSTVARELKRVADKGYEQVIILDADECRTLWPELGLSKRDRVSNVMRIARLCSLLGQQLMNSLIIIPCIAPFHEAREHALLEAEEGGSTWQIYLHAPLIERIKRDPKGLYDRAIRGEISELTGYDGDFEVPFNAEMSVNTAIHSAESIASEIYGMLKLEGNFMNGVYWE